MLFESVDVWKRAGDGELVRYRCFRVLPGDGYCVQSADHYRLPRDAGDDEPRARQFLELLAEESPDARGGTYPTLEEAIRAFDEEFGEV